MVVYPKKNTYLAQLSELGAELKATESSWRNMFANRAASVN